MLRILSRVSHSVRCVSSRTANVNRLNAVFVRTMWQRKTFVIPQSHLLLCRKKAGKGGGKANKDAPAMSMEDFQWNSCKEQMDAVVKECTNIFAQLKVGKADPQFLDSVNVLHNKQQIPLSELAQVNVKDGATLIVSPFEPATTKDIVESLRSSEFELTPTVSGSVIFVGIPKPTKEFKAKLVKKAQTQTEASKQSIRTLRRNLLNDVKKMGLPEDDDRTMQNQAQKLHDDYVKKVENLYKQKEKDLNR